MLLRPTFSSMLQSHCSHSGATRSSPSRTRTASMKRPDWFLVGMGIAVALAWLLPDPGAKGGSLHPEILNKLGVSLIFFLHGLTLSFASMNAGARNWRLHLLVQL